MWQDKANKQGSIDVQPLEFLRNLSQVSSGLLQVVPPLISSPPLLVMAWRHFEVHILT